MALPQRLKLSISANLDVAFTRFNASAFDNTFPQTKIRYASSILSQQEPGWPIGLFVKPNDPIS
jgi:hypothetical protein